MATRFKLRSELDAPHCGNSDFSKLVTIFFRTRCVCKTQMPSITANNYSEDGQAEDIYPDTCKKILSKVILMSNMKALTNIYYFVK